MYVFKISYREREYKPLIILTLIVKENSVMFKMLKDLAKEVDSNIIGLDTVFNSNKISGIVEAVIKSKFNLANEVELEFIKQIATNSNRLLKLIRMAEHDKYIKSVRGYGPRRSRLHHRTGFSKRLLSDL